MKTCEDIILNYSRRNETYYLEIIVLALVVKLNLWLFFALYILVFSVLLFLYLHLQASAKTQVYDYAKTEVTFVQGIITGQFNLLGTEICWHGIAHVWKTISNSNLEVCIKPIGNGP